MLHRVQRQGVTIAVTMPQSCRFSSNSSCAVGSGGCGTCWASSSPGPFGLRLGLVGRGAASPPPAAGHGRAWTGVDRRASPAPTTAGPRTRQRPGPHRPGVACCVRSPWLRRSQAAPRGGQRRCVHRPGHPSQLGPRPSLRGLSGAGPAAFH